MSKSSKTALILGGTGMVGSAIALLLPEIGWKVETTAQTVGFATHVLRLNKSIQFGRDQLEDLLSRSKPDLIINCLYSRNLEESIAAYLLVPHMATNAGIDLINISTNAVFKDSWAPYSPANEPVACSMYELLKVASENLSGPTSIRTSVIGVPLLGTFEEQRQALKLKYPPRKWTGKMWNGCTNLRFAEFICQLCNAPKLPNRVIHYAPSKPLPMCNALDMLFNAYGVPVLKAKRIRAQVSPGKILQDWLPEESLPEQTETLREFLHTRFKKRVKKKSNPLTSGKA